MVSQVRVLHVDDDSQFVDLVATFIERLDEGFEVVSETTAAAGLDVLAETEVDCVVSDYDMPGTDGLQFLDAVRESHPDLPFILFTGKGSEEVASEAIARDVTDYLRKGGGRERYELLANRIRNAVEQHRSKRRAADLERVRTVVRDVNRALVRADSREAIERRVCEILGNTEPYGMAVIGEVDPQTKAIRPRAMAGVDESYFDDWELVVDDEKGQKTPGGRAFREHTIAVSQNVQEDPDYARWHQPATERGLKSLAVVPLVFDDDLYGLLAVLSRRENAFDEEERALLTELGDDLAHAFHARELSLRERAMDEAPIGITLADPSQEGTPLVYVNDRFVELTGYSREEVIGRNCRFLQGPDTREEPVAEMRAALDSEESVTVELLNYRKDGTTFWNRVSLEPLTDADDRVTHYVGFQQDVTERMEPDAHRD